jgi:hypothetical protein
MMNRYEINGDIVTIFMNYNQTKAVIDLEDFDLVNSYPNSWIANDEKYIFMHLPRDGNKRKSIKLHRLLMGFPEGLVVDHINHDPLDNRKSNLRVITRQQNFQNKKGAQINSKSGIRGVVWSKQKKKWTAQYKLNGKRVHVGTFNSVEEAEKAVKEARKKHLPFSNEGEL